MSAVTPDDAPEIPPHATVMTNRVRRAVARAGEPGEGDLFPDGRATPAYLHRLTNALLDEDAERIEAEHLDDDGWADLAWTPARGERRRQAVLRLAGKMLAGGVDAALVLALVDAWNESRCTPPLSDREVDGLVRWVIRRDAERRT